MNTRHEPRTVRSLAPIRHGGAPVTSWLTRAGASLATWRLWITCACAFGLFAAVFFGSSAPFAVPTVEHACGQAPPDVRFTSTAADIHAFLTACGQAGRDAYRSLQLADLVYPTVFGMFLATSLALVLSRLAPGRPSLGALAVLPLLGSAFDYLENVCAWLALTAFPEPVPASTLLGLASAAKTLTFWTAGAILVGGLSLQVCATVRRRVRPGAHRASA